MSLNYNAQEWLQECKTCKKKKAVWEESQNHTLRIASLYELIDMKDGESNDRRIPAKIHCIIDRKDDDDNNTQRSRNSGEQVVSERSQRIALVLAARQQNQLHPITNG